MATSVGTIQVPIIARVDGKDVDLGVLALEVKIIHGRVKTPTAREIKAALRRGLR